jgi:hypothetical protein
MARCGRCGLFYKYPSSHKEKGYTGACLWYQFRLTEDEAYRDRKCADFFEKLPGVSPGEHFDYKVKRIDMNSAFIDARTGRWLAILALAISLSSILLGLLR